MIVLDTHVLVWWVTGTAALSLRARREIRSALADGPLHASAISVLEIATAVRRRWLNFAIPVEHWLDELAVLPELRFEPVTPHIARVAGSFDDAAPGDPADRLIAATALALGAKLITADGRLRRFSRLQAIW